MQVEEGRDWLDPQNHEEHSGKGTSDRIWARESHSIRGRKRNAWQIETTGSKYSWHITAPKMKYKPVSVTYKGLYHLALLPSNDSSLRTLTVL